MTEIKRLSLANSAERDWQIVSHYIRLEASDCWRLVWTKVSMICEHDDALLGAVSFIHDCDETLDQCYVLS